MTNERILLSSAVRTSRQPDGSRTGKRFWSVLHQVYTDEDTTTNLLLQTEDEDAARLLYNNKQKELK